METATMILNAISTIGFPIVLTLILLWYINKKDEKQDQRNAEFVKAIENNTRAVDALTIEIKRS
ncbi:MAG: hypothetical protein J6T77_06150 [Clostridia bacterium]|nr:hypothetical protein [Clostridia bacterium]